MTWALDLEKKQNKLLSLDEVISAVLESYDDDLSDNDESDSDIGDFEDDEGNQELFILNTQTSRQQGTGRPAYTRADAIYCDTSLDSEDQPELWMAFLDVDYIPRNFI